MRYLLVLLLIGCARPTALPVSAELWPFAQEWNKACDEPMFYESPPGAQDQDETRVKYSDRTDNTCPHAAVVYNFGGRAADIYVQNCWYSSVTDQELFRRSMLHELGHVAYIWEHSPDENAMMHAHGALELTAEDIRMARKYGWACR